MSRLRSTGWAGGGRARARRLLVVLAAAVVLAGCTGERPAAAEPCAPGAVQVGPSARDLQRALDDAEPGDVLQLADVAYEGRFTVERPGMPDAPITLCGSGASVLDGGSVDAGYVLHLDGASWWVLEDFTVRNGQKGVMLDGADDNVLRALTVEGTGHEGIHLRAHSSGNRIEGSEVRGTGLVVADYGEGIYIGSAESNWCRYTDCEPDRSDRNTIVGVTVSDVTAEAIDIKEGSSAGVVRGSDLTGAAGAGVVDVKGNDWMLTGNVVRAAGPVGVEVHVRVAGWGERNAFTANTFSFPGEGIGVALVGEARSVGNRIACDQEVPSGSRVTDTGCAAP